MITEAVNIPALTLEEVTLVLVPMMMMIVVVMAIFPLVIEQNAYVRDL